MDAKIRKQAANEVRRVNRYRDFPHNTCPASRHVQLMAEFLAKGERYAMLDEEPEYVASAMLSVVGSLYKARSELAKLKRKKTPAQPPK